MQCPAPAPRSHPEVPCPWTLPMTVTARSNKDGYSAPVQAWRHPSSDCSGWHSSGTTPCSDRTLPLSQRITNEESKRVNTTCFVVECVLHRGRVKKDLSAEKLSGRVNEWTL